MGDGPKSLPAVEGAASREQIGLTKFQKATVCDSCGQDGRVVSNRNGVTVYCGPCKKSWGISSAPLVQEVPATMERGLRKRTLVEPDWSKAQED
jgi:hypothetical protein